MNKELRIHGFAHIEFQKTKKGLKIDPSPSLLSIACYLPLLSDEVERKAEQMVRFSCVEMAAESSVGCVQRSRYMKPYEAL